METKRIDERNMPLNKEVLILNKPFCGEWLKSHEIGHEIIDFLLSDDGNYYVYCLPHGTVPKKQKGVKYNSRFLLLCESGTKNIICQYVVELSEPVHEFETISRSQKIRDKFELFVRSKQLIITYGGRYLYEIFKEDSYLYVTYKAQRLIKLHNPINITGDFNFNRNKAYIYSDGQNSELFAKINNRITDDISNYLFDVVTLEKLGESRLDAKFQRYIANKYNFLEDNKFINEELRHTNIVTKNDIKQIKNRTNRQEFVFEEETKYDVFISYASEDRMEAEDFAELLQNNGYKVYIDSLDTHLDPRKVDEKTGARIANMLDISDCLLFIRSEKSTSSRWCSWEIGYMSSRTRHKRCGVITIKKGSKSVFSHIEFLMMYPILKKTLNSDITTLRGLEFYKPKESKALSFDDFIKYGWR